MGCAAPCLRTADGQTCAQAPELANGRARAPAPPAGSPAPPAAKRKREEVLAWDARLLAGADGAELCFEEVRGASLSPP
jgi:hypothetical protein